MQKEIVLITLTAAGIALPAGAQNLQRRAAIMSGGNPDHGRCVAEVVVDGAANVEIRGNTGVLRDLSGRAPQWRRLECTGPIPANPVNFRFRGIDGRGRQELIRDPRNGGSAVVHIEDREGGAEGYTFELTWDNGFQGGYQGRGGFPAYGERDRSGYAGRRFTSDQAVQACQDAVRQQGWARFHSRDMYFRQTRIDDTPGRNDWVVGVFDVRPNNGPERRYRFSCSVDFGNGRMRSVDMEPESPRGEAWRAAPGFSDAAIDNCRRAVTDRIRERGYGRVEFSSLNVDNNPGRRDSIVGMVRAQDNRRSDAFDFACAVNMENGRVRSVDVNRR